MRQDTDFYQNKKIPPKEMSGRVFIIETLESFLTFELAAC